MAWGCGILYSSWHEGYRRGWMDGWLLVAIAPWRGGKSAAVGGGVHEQRQSREDGLMCMEERCSWCGDHGRALTMPYSDTTCTLWLWLVMSRGGHICEMRSASVPVRHLSTGFCATATQQGAENRKGST